MGVVFLFIDGVGLGEERSDNPLIDHKEKIFPFMTDGQPFTNTAKTVRKGNHFFTGVDATLGVEGLPQSGTGQATLFSGENAAKEIGKHFGPFPHSGIKHLLRKQSLFKKAQARGKSCSFINAYPEIFFEKAEARNRWSCTTLMTKSAGLPLNTVKEVKNERAITAGITQQAWREHLKIDVPEITPEQAALRLHKVAADYDLLLYEYYLTDKAGHSQEKEKAEEVINRYDRFLWELIQSRPDSTTIVLCSDHGNIEDLSTKTHTYNKVPLFVLGRGAEAFYGAESIMDVAPGVLGIL
ncbi:MAG: alkaline phosphatase family protein [Balneolaceae bacterium]|nr:alkaline phosphatase family protein [Balneolaceae bacterium]